MIDQKQDDNDYFQHEDDAMVIELQEDISLIQHDIHFQQHHLCDDEKVEFPIDQLSDDVLCHILSFISTKQELFKLASVNRRFYNCSNHESLWKIAVSCKEERRKLKNFNILYQETTRFDSSQLPILSNFKTRLEFVHYKKKRWQHMDGIEQSYRANDEIREMTRGVNIFTQLLILLVTCAIPMLIATVFVMYGLFADGKINAEQWSTFLLVITCVGIIFSLCTVFLCGLHFGFVPCGISSLLRHMSRNTVRNLNLERFRMIFFRDHVDPLSNFYYLFCQPVTAWIWVLFCMIVFKFQYFPDRPIWSYIVIPVYVAMAFGLMEPCFRSISYKPDSRDYPVCDPFHLFLHMVGLSSIWICIAISIALICAKLDNPTVYTWGVVLSAIYVPLLFIAMISILLFALTWNRKYFPMKADILFVFQPFMCFCYICSAFCFVLTILLCLKLIGLIGISFLSIFAALSGICCCSTFICTGVTAVYRSQINTRIFR